MKKLVLPILLGLALSLNAQTLDIPKDTINGKVVWLYPVQKSEGLYRISKNFGVSQEEIIEMNPLLKTEGLKVGQVIKIPFIAPIDSSEYVVHELQPKETLYGLSKKYGVKQSDIEKLNPKTIKKMMIGQKLLIKKADIPNNGEQTPAQSAPAESTPAEIVPAETTPTETVPAESALTETVPAESAPTETVPAAATEEILVENAEGVRVSDEIEKSDNFLNPENAVESDTSVEQEVVSLLPLRLTVLLPFMSNQTKRDDSNDRFVDFYEGVLLAINEAQKKGQKFEINTYDTEKSESKLQKILQQPEILNSDFIIGPAYPQQVSIVSNFAFDNKIPVLVPFTNRVSDIKTNPYLLQFNVSDEKEAQFLADTLANRGNTQIVVISNQNTETDASIVRLLLNLREKSVETTTVSFAQLQADSLQYFLEPSKENLIIFPSEKYGYVQQWFGKLTNISSKFNLTLLTQYAWLKEDMPKNLHYVYASVFEKPAFTSLNTITYNLQRSYYFKHDRSVELPYYDMLGYDLTNYIIKLLQQPSGNNLQQKAIKLGRQEGLQSDLNFEPIENGGLENTFIHLIEK